MSPSLQDLKRFVRSWKSPLRGRSRRPHRGRNANWALCTMELLEPRLLLSGTSYLVDSLDDAVASDGVVTLREAIEAANTNQPVYDAPAGSSSESDIIEFAPSLNGGTIVLSGRELFVTDDLDIRGPGANQLAIDADGRSRVFSFSFF